MSVAGNHHAMPGRFQQQADCAVGGRIVNALPGNAPALFSDLLMAYLYAFYNADPAHARLLISCNLALPAAGFALAPWAKAVEERATAPRVVRASRRFMTALLGLNGRRRDSDFYGPSDSSSAPVRRPASAS